MRDQFIDLSHRFERCRITPALSLPVLIGGLPSSLQAASSGRVTGWGGEIIFPINTPGITFSVISAGGYHNLASQPNGTITAPILAGCLQNRSITSPVQSMLQNSFDPDGDTFMLSSVSPQTSQGGRAESSGSSIVYTPPDGFTGTDHVTCTVTDTTEATSEGSGTVIVANTAGPGPTGLVTELRPTSLLIRFVGIPGQAYDTEVCSNLLAHDWKALASVDADAVGVFHYVDTWTPSQTVQYYRSKLR